MPEQKQWIVTGISMVVEADTAEEAIARADQMSGWHWEAHPAGGYDLDLGPAGTYLNPTAESVAAEVAEEARVKDEIATFPQTPEDARTCEHGNRVWFGNECGLCDDQGFYRWHDAHDCQMVPIGSDPEDGEYFRCTVHNYEVLGDAYVCEGYTAPPYTGGH